MKGTEEPLLPEWQKSAQRRQIEHKKSLLGSYCYYNNSEEDFVDIKERALENTNIILNMLKKLQNKSENL